MPHGQAVPVGQDVAPNLEDDGPATAQVLVGDPTMQRREYWETQPKTKGELDSMIEMYRVLKVHGKHKKKRRMKRGESLEKRLVSLDALTYDQQHNGVAPAKPALSAAFADFRAGNGTAELTKYLEERSDELIQHWRFRWFFSTVIIMNSIQLWLSTDLRLLGPRGQRMVDIMFTLLFVCEIIPRLLAAHYRKKMCNKYLIFDVCVVSIAVLDMVILGWIDAITVDFRVFTHLRVLQMIQKTKIDGIELTKQGRSIRLALVAMAQSTWLVWLIFLTWVPIVTFWSFAVRSALHEVPVSDLPSNKVATVWNTLITLTAAATNGFEWYRLFWELDTCEFSGCQQAGVLLWMFGIIAHIVVVPKYIACFVQAMVLTSRTVRSDHTESNLRTEIQVDKLRRVLEHVDIDDNGRISNSEFDILRKNYADLLKTWDIYKYDLTKIWATLEHDETGEVPIDNFIMGYIKYYGFSKTLGNMCWELGLRTLHKEIASTGVRHDRIDECQDLAAATLAKAENQVRSYIEEQRADQQALHDILGRLGDIQRTLDVGLHGSEKGFEAVAECYAHSEDQADIISGLRTLVMRRDLEETMEVAIQWAQSMDVDVDAVLQQCEACAEDAGALPDTAFHPAPSDGHESQGRAWW